MEVIFRISSAFFRRFRVNCATENRFRFSPDKIPFSHNSPKRMIIFVIVLNNMSAACRYLPAIFGACNWLWEMHSDARDGAPHSNDFVLFSIALNILMMMMMMMHSIAYDVSERSYWNWVSNHIIYFSHFWANRWDWQILGLWTWCIWRCSSKHFDHFYFDIF